MACGLWVTPSKYFRNCLSHRCLLDLGSDDVGSSEPDRGDGLNVLEELPDWQNPDGEQLLASALRQEQGNLFAIRWSSGETDFSATAVLSRVWPCLQMICETLRLPFRRDVVDRMLKGMVGNKPAPTLGEPRPDC